MDLKFSVAKMHIFLLTFVVQCASGMLVNSSAFFLSLCLDCIPLQSKVRRCRDGGGGMAAMEGEVDDERGEEGCGLVVVEVVGSM